ncbi:MAG TPA: DUF2058 family protein [Xanthomonadaceae bacterium]|nr:DUF2058 family protein [Xanthomonadaceae bacterium]
MADSLKDQLMALGFKPKAREPRQEKRGGPAQRRAGPARAKATSKEKRQGGELDLARAYALREREERAQRQREQREREALARLRREARARLDVLLEGHVLNDPAAEQPRHFEYGGRIRRIYVTPGQLARLNAGALAVLQVRGRYLLVEPAVADQAEQILPGTLALRVDPDAPAPDADYADPRFQVPDDLVW